MSLLTTLCLHQVDLKARRDGYMYTESVETAPASTAPPTAPPTAPATAPDGAGAGTVVGGGGGGGGGDARGDAAQGAQSEMVGGPGEIVRGDPGELIQPTDDFDVLVLQFQKGERQEAEEAEEAAAAEAAAEGAAAAAEPVLAGRDRFDVGGVVVE